MNIIKNIYKKILDSEALLTSTVENIKQKKLKIVFTNGCFDILHRGHIEYLAKGKELGDILLVALNSDESVKKLKGQDRPINRLEDRMFLLASLSFVDYVTNFSETTPTEILKKIRPDIHIKGGDYSLADLPEREVIQSYGGKIYILPYVQGYSTSNILKNKI
ncbi:MAG: D-glycero-beta-D-manno-heptose 1-phosphate adenylyltransferase [Leptonema sp. (in: bacteria)]